jgi:hypothetical protein
MTADEREEKVLEFLNRILRQQPVPSSMLWLHESNSGCETTSQQ